MHNSVSCKLILYADDYILLVPGNNVTYISNSLQLQLGLIRDWLSINKLSLHIGKTESILFGTKRKLNNCEKLNVICDGNLIESKINVKYLGLIIDETLSGTAIALNITAKNNQRLKFVYRNTRNFNMNTKKQLTMALIQCHFYYACPAWYSGLTKRMKHRLQCAQNKIIRYVLNLSPITHYWIRRI